MNTLGSPTIYTLKQAAAILGVGVTAARNAMLRGELRPAGPASGGRLRRRHLHLVTAGSVHALAEKWAVCPPRGGSVTKLTVTGDFPGVGIQEVAQRLGVTRQRIYQLLAQGRLRACAVKPIMVSEANLVEYQARSRRTTDEREA